MTELAPPLLVYADLRLDVAEHRAWRGDRCLALTLTRFRLLELFMRRPQVVLTRPWILERVWGITFPIVSNTVDNAVCSLRRELEAGGEPRVIRTVHSVGFVLREGP